MSKDNFVIIREFNKGWQKKLDETRIPLGAAQESTNVIITERGGISPRPGEVLIGTASSGTGGIQSMHSFKKTYDDDILIKSYDTKLEYYNNVVSDWCLLKSGYQNAKKFGFKEHTIDGDALDWLYFGNGVDSYSRWGGYESKITSALVGGETTIPVETTLLDTVIWSGTASSCTTTTITVPEGTWAASAWNQYYVRITNGANAGQISLIRGTTGTTITFFTLAGLSGTPTFEIRRLAVPCSFYRATASSVSTTTINVAGTPWIASEWIGSYVAITDGANARTVRQITANTTSQITFATVTGLSGTPTFEIQQESTYHIPRQLAYGTSTVTYTAVPTDTSFTVNSAVACADDTGVTVTPQEFPENPRGNILETSIAQMFVGGVPSAYTTIFRSHLTDATDFTQSSPRDPSEGDIVYFPYSGHRITDIKSQENLLYVFKRDSIESLTYTQDELDIAQINSIVNGVNVGTEGKAWRMDNDIAFVTPDKRITSIGRVKLNDNRPQVTNIADSIMRAMDEYGVDNSYGEEYRDRAFICLKSSPDVASNDILLVRNKDLAAWEGIWQIASNVVVAHNGKLYYGSSYSADVYEMLVGVNKVKGSDVFPVTSSWWSGYINRNGSGFYLNEIACLSVEGYITSGTTINFNLYKDFAELPFQQLSISGLETDFQDGLPTFSLLGGDPLGMEPLGASSVVGEPDPDGRRHFIAFLDFPITPVEYISVEVASSGLAQSYEIIALGLGLNPVAFESQPRIQSNN